MSADRYELRADHTDWLDVRDPQGYRNTINQPGAVALIRQQARDLEQLRTDLAAAITARANMDTDRLEWMNRAEQAEARLAALAELEKSAGEPVATLVGFDVESRLPADIAWHVDCSVFNSGDKLYTAPPPAKPAPGMFTAEEMKEAYREGYSDLQHGRRILEADWRISITFKLIQERTS